jgi:MFS family permease
MDRQQPEAQSLATTLWAVPGTRERPAYGAPAAMNAVGTIAAPLLAGFSFSVVGEVLQVSSGGIRWPDLAILFLIAAGLTFLATLQLTLWARQWEVTPREILDWWPDARDESLRSLQQQQHMLRKKYEGGVSLAILAFHAGMTSFLSGLLVLLVPAGAMTPARAMAVGLVTLGLVIIVAWTVGREFVGEVQSGSIRKALRERRPGANGRVRRGDGAK